MDSIGEPITSHKWMVQIAHIAAPLYDFNVSVDMCKHT